MDKNYYPPEDTGLFIIDDSERVKRKKEGENHNFKLFMGQIPSSMREKDIKLELGKYCQIDHVVVLRDAATKKHKHCAFIYVSSEEDAQTLIKIYNGNVVLPGMNSAVTMVFSEKKNKKNKTKSVEISTPVVRKCVLNNPDSVNQDNSLITSESSPSNPLSTSPSVQSSEPSPGYPVFCPPLYPQPSSIVYFPVANSQPISVNSPAVLSLTPLSTYYSVCNHPCSLVSDVFGYHTEGPKGANLFIYHLPTDIQENFLYSLFSTYGTVVSTIIYRDRETNLSKGFGFVSMSSVEEADRAIKFLNGYPIQGKLIKVQRKKEKQ